MKKTLAIFLVAVLAVTALCACLTASAADLTVSFTQEAGTATDEGSVTLFPADEAFTLTSADANLRWAFVMVADKDGKIVRLAKHLLRDTDDNAASFPTRGVDVPAGGFAIVFHTGANGDKNAELRDYYDALVAAAGVDPSNTAVDVKVDWQIVLNSDKSGATYYKGAAPAGDTTPSGDNNSSTPSSDASTSSTPSKVPTGDNGIIVFAVLGLVAVAGAAVAVKARR